MHELSLVQNLLEIIEDYSESKGFDRVNSLRLSYGAMSCIDKSTLEFTFSVLSKGTRAENADLIMETLPIVIYCMKCEKEFVCKALPDTCPDCKGGEILMSSGTEELRLIEMDVD